MLRRTFIIGALALGIAACASWPSQNIAKVAKDVSLIADAFQASLAQLATVKGIDPKTVASIGQRIAELQVLSQQLANVNEANAAQPLVQRIVANVNTVISTVSILPFVPPGLSTVMTAASILLPVIQMAVNIVMPEQLQAHRMSVDEARTVLMKVK
jgi:hypothetical protein